MSTHSVVSDRTLGSRYALQHEIGRGGMGVVYRAHDLKYDRPVAVKFLNADATGLVGAERFADEIRTTARLRHQNILQVDDSDEIDGELFYVMPYVEGPSLRERLDRGPRVGVLEALRIARQAAAALAYAHSHGIIHRDIKPDNILLGHDGHVYVADFGLAQVLARSENRHLTAVGLALGTPAYMSPEQATTEPLDGRSDLYSLGCVLFEALAGEPPFAGTDAPATMRRQVVETAPSLRRRRADVTPGVDRLVARLLEKHPDDRFPSADALAEALDAEIVRLSAGAVTAEPEARDVAGIRRRWLVAGGAVGALALAAWFVARASLASGGDLDADRWLLLPLRWQGDVPADVRTTQDARIYDAFARWTDLDLVGRVAAEAGVGAVAAGAPVDRDARAIARDQGAGRVLDGLATVVGDSIQLDLRASSVGDGTLLSRVSLRVPRDGSRPDVYALLADSLLFGRVTWDGEHPANPGTSSAAAFRAYAEGRWRLSQWDVQAAESAFAAAISVDPTFARPQFWLAQFAAVRGERSDAQMGAVRADTLSLTARERLLAGALSDMSSGRQLAACDAYALRANLDPRDFFALYGLGECRTADRLVVRAAESPSGWRFRSSRAAAMEAYEHALTTAPGSHRFFRDAGFERLRSLLMTRANDLWLGHEADGTSFSAQPELLDDTLALVPRPWSSGPGSWIDRTRNEAAARRQRLRFERIARTWVEAYPASVDAVHALALAHDMLSDPAAVPAVARARSLATTDAARRDLATLAVWTGFKFSSLDPGNLRRVRLLADSLLDTHPRDASATENERASALAILLGRPAAAATLARRAQPAVGTIYDVSAALLRPAAALLMFASAGGPADSIARIETRLLDGLSHAVSDQQRTAALHELERAAMLSAPAAPMHVLLADRDRLRDPTARAWAALHAGNAASARRASVELARRWPEGVPPAALTPDMLYSQAALHAAVGDTAAAIAWLDPTLDQMEWIQPGVIDDAANAGALLRAIALRARLAMSTGDSTTANRFATAVVTLWSGGEPHALAVVDEMRSLGARTSSR